MKEKKSSVIKNNIYFLRLVWKVTPTYVMLEFFKRLFDYTIWSFYSITFTKYLFGEGIKNRSFKEVCIFICAALLVSLIETSFRNWYGVNFMQKAQIRCRSKLNLMLFEKARAVDLSCYENPEFYNTYTKAATEVKDRAFAVLNNCATLVAATVAAVYVIITMANITPWALLFVALPFLVNTYFGKKSEKLYFKINAESTPDSRMLGYVNRAVYLRQYAGELRLTNIYSVLEKMYRQSAKNIANINLKYANKSAFYQIFPNLLGSLFGYQGMWICVALLAVSGKIAIGGLVVLVNAVNTASEMIYDIQNSYLQMTKNALYIENLKSFLNFTPKIDETAEGKDIPEKIDNIEFKNVSFTYDGQNKPVLKNISLKMEMGNRYALVGINGSGKTTLIKLLMRFYDPTEGEILLNGINIKEFGVKKYRDLIGAAFQDFALFSVSVSENVLLKEVESEQDSLDAVNALKKSGAWDKIETLANKENSVLTKEFDKDGVELSGGEKQKIAIARAFAKNSPIVVLDEPSSALDPIAEDKMFKTITRLCENENKLSIIVSHRLSSTAICEGIFVFSKGELIEKGTHKELLQLNGMYADMFYKQAENYTERVGENNEN